MTSMSGASERVSRMPRRIKAWSSQRKTLIMWFAPWRPAGRRAAPRPAAPPRGTANEVSVGASYVGPLAGVVGAVGLLLLGQVVGAVGHVERHREDQGRAVRSARQVDPAADGVGALVQA